MSRRSASPALLALALAACGGGGGGGSVRLEAAAGEGPAAAETLGTLAPGGTLRVRGTVTAFAEDPFDAFRVEAQVATRVELELSGTDAEPVDLDLWVATEAAEVLERFEAGGTAPETGSFELAAGESRVVVVLAGARDGGYDLVLRGRAPGQ